MRCALAARTFGAMVMNGSSWPTSKNSATRSSRIAGAKWTKPGTLLHARIEPILHGSIPRVGEDRAMPQGTGADFGAPLEPTDDLSRGQIARDLLDELRLGQSLVRQAGLPEGVADFRVTVAKLAKGGSRPTGARAPPPRLMIVRQRTAKRRARV